KAEDIPHTIAEAFHIASTCRPGPVLVDIAKDGANLRTGRRRYPAFPGEPGRVSGPRAREISPVSVHTRLTPVHIRGRVDPAVS
ncbi:hypothetical protein ACWDBC_33650, partial [Streptomyces parvus]